MKNQIDLNRHIYEGWRIKDFINDLDPLLSMVMRGESHITPFEGKKELSKWLQDNQPYYKQPIPELVEYFSQKYQIVKP